MVPLIRFLFFLVCCPAFACDYPDEGNMPLRRAVSKVKFLPETEAWAAAMHKTGAVVQYALLLDEPRHERGRCYWPVDVRAEGKLWRRYYVSPDGRKLLPQAAKAPQAAIRPEGSTAAAP
jgi:hypothetical protein